MKLGSQANPWGWDAMTEPDLEGLLARCGLGDRAAFRDIYARVGSKLFGVCLRILGNRGDAEEATQEAFVKIWHNAGRYRAERGGAVAWMVSIARNQAIDLLRARKALADKGPTPEASAIGADERRRIEACLRRLAEDRAAAVRAAYLEGHSYDDLARRFGVPLNTMRSWLRRALLTLRECLES